MVDSGKSGSYSTGVIRTTVRVGSRLTTPTPDGEKASPKNTPATVKIRTLTVYVRETFFRQGQGECRFPAGTPTSPRSTARRSPARRPRQADR
jgi:hypothetical protein